MGAYEQGGYRPSPTVSCLPSNTRLAVGEHPPPSTPSRHQTMDDVNHSWAVWYNKLKDAYTLQTADIRRQQVTLAVQRKQTKDGKAIGDWQDTPSVQEQPTTTRSKKAKRAHPPQREPTARTPTTQTARPSGIRIQRQSKQFSKPTSQAW